MCMTLVFHSCLAGRAATLLLILSHLVPKCDTPQGATMLLPQKEMGPRFFPPRLSVMRLQSMRQTVTSTRSYRVNACWVLDTMLEMSARHLTLRSQMLLFIPFHKVMKWLNQHCQTGLSAMPFICTVQYRSHMWPVRLLATNHMRFSNTHKHRQPQPAAPAYPPQYDSHTHRHSTMIYHGTRALTSLLLLI